jgi:hypothetical protein
MAINPIIEQNLIVAELEARFTPPVYEDDQVSVSYTNGEISEYITVDFGSPVATYNNRSIGAEQKQPYNQRVIVGYVAGSKSAARAGASSIAVGTPTGMTGFVPSTNSGPLRLVGGGSYTIAATAAKPIEFISEVYFLFTSNLAGDN